MAGRKAAQSALKLSPVLDLNQASLLHGRLTELRGSPVEIDASDVERIGAQCAQVLVAGIKAWQADGKPFNISKTSDAFDKTLKLIGVDLERISPKEI